MSAIKKLFPKMEGMASLFEVKPEWVQRELMNNHWRSSIQDL